MLIAKVQDGSVQEIASPSVIFPHCSFPLSGPDAEWLQENSCMEVRTSAPFNGRTEKLAQVPPYIDGNYVYTVAVVPLDADELAALDAAEGSRIRAQRNALLAACDWTQLADAPVDSLAWAVYRQELREIPTSAGFPWNITWPVPPHG